MKRVNQDKRKKMKLNRFRDGKREIWSINDDLNNWKINRLINMIVFIKMKINK